MDYTITKYECVSQATEIGALANAANIQQARNSGFHTNVQPWKQRCKDDSSIHWIARSPGPDGTIVGWLVAMFSERNGQKYGFIYEIARNRHVHSAGVGLQLHNAFLTEAAERGADFTFLYPLNAAVASLYKRPEWGYVEVHPKITMLFHVLRAPPSEEFLQEYYPPTVKKLVDKVYELKNIVPKNEYLGRLIITSQRFLASDPKSTKELMEFADMTYGSLNDHESFLEFRHSLQDKLQAYIVEKGGRLPREIKHTYKNSGGRRSGGRWRRKTVRGRR